MYYIRLLCIFSCLCLWHGGEATPFIRILASSRTSNSQMIGGRMRTLYDFSVQDNVNDLTGKLVRTRVTNLKSDFNPPIKPMEGSNVIIIQ